MFNQWLYCSKCHFSGDPINAYIQAFKLPNARDGLDALCRDLKLPALDPDDIERYVAFDHRYYGEIQALWAHARKEAANLSVYGPTGRLYELGLWTNKDIFEKAFDTWFGVTDKAKAEELLQRPMPAGIRDFERLLLIPYFIVPGFIGGYGIIGYKDVMHYLPTVNNMGPAMAGLCDLAGMQIPELFCIPDVLSAARVRQKAVIEGCNYLPVVAAAPVPNLDLGRVQHPVILWQDEPTPELLKQCIMPRNFRVLLAETPYSWRPTEKRSKLWETRTLPEIHREITSKPLHDPVALFVKVILEAPSAKAAALMSELRLTDFQQKVIMAACPEDSRRELLKLLNRAVTVEPVVLNKKTYYQKDGKWWVSGSRETADEVVSEVTMAINHVCRVANSTRAVVFGTLQYAGKTIDFMETEEELERSGRAGIYQTLASAGITEQPFIADSVKKLMFTIALMFKTPEVIMVQDYVGFSEAQNRFNLPNIAVDPVSIKVGVPFVLPDTHTPCTNIVAEPGMEMASITRLFQDTPETVAYWAAMAAVIANINRVMTKDRSTNVMLVGSKGSLAHHIFDVLQMDLGLTCPRVNRAKALSDEAHLAAQLHHVPVAIDGTSMSPRVVLDWFGGEGYNSLAVGSRLQAAALGYDKDWTFVRADVPLRGESLSLLHSERVFPFMLQLMLTTRPSSAAIFLEHLVYLGRSLGADTSVLNKAKALLSEGSVVRTRSPAMQLMSLLQAGTAEGVFKAMSGARFQKTYTVLNDPWQHEVSLNISNMVGQIRYNDLPLANWDAAFDELKRMGMREVQDQNKLVLVGPKAIWERLTVKASRIRRAYAEFLRQLMAK